MSEARNPYQVCNVMGDMAEVDPVFLGLIAALVLFFFLLYLLVRRTIVGFREGYQRGQNRE